MPPLMVPPCRLARWRRQRACPGPARLGTCRPRMGVRAPLPGQTCHSSIVVEGWRSLPSRPLDEPQAALSAIPCTSTGHKRTVDSSSIFFKRSRHNCRCRPARGAEEARDESQRRRRSADDRALDEPQTALSAIPCTSTGHKRTVDSSSIFFQRSRHNCRCRPARGAEEARDESLRRRRSAECVLHYRVKRVTQASFGVCVFFAGWAPFRPGAEIGR